MSAHIYTYIHTNTHRCRMCVYKGIYARTINGLFEGTSDILARALISILPQSLFHLNDCRQILASLGSSFFWLKTFFHHRNNANVVFTHWWQFEIAVLYTAVKQDFLQGFTHKHYSAEADNSFTYLALQLQSCSLIKLFSIEKILEFQEISLL